jgi:hypothetical protein
MNTNAIPGVGELIGTNADGSRQWLVDGKVLSDEQFDALIARQHLPLEAEALIDRELGEPLIGLGLRRAARLGQCFGMNPERLRDEPEGRRFSSDLFWTSFVAVLGTGDRARQSDDPSGAKTSSSPRRAG